jgi:ribonuclease BN (tRNA processing enzyme)
MSKFLKFWGTRGSCPVSGPPYAKFGGNTSCVEIRYGEAHLILDAGTGIRPLGVEMLKDAHPVHLILSHTHWDHVIGFPFFEPLYSPDSEITIWSPSKSEEGCSQIFDDLMSEKFFPIQLSELRAKLHFFCIDEKQPIRIGPLTVHSRRAHHPSTTYCLKITTPHQTIGYASDNEMFKNYHGDLMHAPADDSIVPFFTGCDLLIHEAQYFLEEYLQKVGWGHSSVSNAAALVHKARIKRWLVTHHDPKHTDDELHSLAALSQRLLTENKIPCRSEWVADGHTVFLD